MAITINSAPANYRLTRDPLIYQVTGSEYVITAGVLHVFEFSFTTDPADGNTILIESEFITPGKTFTFVPSIPGWFANGSEIRVRVASETVANWIEDAVIPGFMAFPQISEKYEVYRNGNNVVIRAIDFGPSFNLTDLVPTGFTISGPGAIAGVLPEYRENYFIRARVNLESEHQNGQYIRSPWFFFSPDTTGEISTDFSSKVDELFDWSHFISNAQFAPIRRMAEVRRFHIEFGEHYGENPFDQVNRRSPLRTVMKGASRGRSVTDSFLSAHFTSPAFLSRRAIHSNIYEYSSVGRNTRHHQFAILSWSLQGFGGELVQRAKVFYTDGTNDEITTFTLTGASSGELWALQCGFDALNLGILQPAKTAYAYEIRVIDDEFGVQVVKPVYFRLINLGMNYRQVQFINRFGVSECRTLIGAHIEESVPGRETMTRARTIPLSTTEADEHSYNISENTRLIVGSQAFNDWNSDEILDLIMSPYNLISLAHSPTTFMPATILNKEAVLKSFDPDGNSTRAISLEFKLNTRK